MAAPSLIEVRAPEAEAEGTRSQLLRWLKARGEPVARDEPLLEVETDKVTVEISSPATGVLREVLKQAQEEIAPGELLARIEAADSLAAPASSGTAPERDARSHAAAMPEAAARGEPQPQARSGAPLREAGRLSPAVMRLLAQHGLEAAAVQGSGPSGRITVDDVLRCAAGSRADALSPPGRADAAGARDREPDRPARAPQGPQAPGGRLVPHSPMRKRIAEHMVRSVQTAPHVTTVFEADFSAVLAHRTRCKDEFASQGAALTLTAYVLAACVEAIRAVPEANARWTDEALEIFDRIDIGVATALADQGLIVPVIRGVDTLSLLEIARELGRLVALAREGRLAPEDVRGGTFTLSNHGVSGSLLAAPIVINQPQTAILGIGRIEKRPVVIEEGGAERIVARPRAYLTLTLDHRVMDGHRANRFLEALVKRIEAWA
jgi:2-oxoglutarate dehydrogenase E2 component (dihydrolipoamide succinyltransferase)